MRDQSALGLPVRLSLVALLAPFLALGAAAYGQCTEGCRAIHVLEGEVAGDQFGWVSNDLGDIDGDGVREFVLTAPTNDGGAANAGRIYVYDGASGTERWRASGSGGSWWLGHDAAWAGSIDDDGLPDVIAGAPFSGPGRAIIYSGADGAVIHTWRGEASSDQFGFRVYGGGDFDGDGRDDMVVGAPLNDAIDVNAGRAYVYSGDDFSLIATLDGLERFDNFGSGVAFIGDVTGDGRDDVAIGARGAGATGGGLGYVFSFDGKTAHLEYELDPGPVSNNFGQWFMNGGHDVNRDGTPDVYVNDFGVNLAHIFSGVDGSKIWELSGNGNGGFGIGRIVDDVDGDCFADMILAAWISDEGASNAGKAFVYSGRDGSVMETFTHDRAGAGFGFDANGMGDVDGDGIFDYLITAASDLSSRGRAYVIAGTIAPPRTGDVTRDGVVDFADILGLLAAWGVCGPPPDACPADIDCSGVVDFADVLLVLANWG